MTETAYAIVVGDGEDPHVRAVVEQLPGAGLVIIDAVQMPAVMARLNPAITTLADVTGAPVEIRPDGAVRGWIRRLAPAGWDHGVALGSHRSAVLAARLALLAAVLRDTAVDWLTAVDDLFGAENKIVQYRAAIGTGVRVPDFVVSGDPTDLSDYLGQRFVLKPLGPGNFEDDHGDQQVVFVREIQAAGLNTVDLLDAPFLAQRAVRGRCHLRVVTVGESAWVAELDATGLPLDWRAHEPAHRSFHASSRWGEVERAAVTLASTLRAGFTSQDWIVDDAGPAFLDLNPGGQWLFLPDEVSAPVTAALAEWLRGGA
ncbi:MAG: hypothetical protein ACRDRP_22650 [Pseudonocardiaceae bacterium]